MVLVVWTTFMVSMQSKSNHVVLESVIFFFRMRIFIIQIKIYSFF